MGDTAESTSTNNLPVLKLKLKVRKILDTTVGQRNLTPLTGRVGNWRSAPQGRPICSLIMAASEALSLGYGGISRIRRISGLFTKTHGAPR